MQQLGFAQQAALSFFLVAQQVAGAFFADFGVFGVAKAPPKVVATRNKAGTRTFNMMCLLFFKFKVTSCEVLTLGRGSLANATRLATKVLNSEDTMF
ncbi:MAG: hypothetical protein SNJ67_03980 [Chloracidobacterium sp.]